MKKKLMSLILTFVMVLAMSVPAYAAEAVAEVAQTPVLASELREPTVTFEDGAMTVNGEIYQRASDGEGRFIYFLPVGTYDFTFRPFLDNGYGEAEWRITLTNGDYIKGVEGGFSLWIDVLGPFNNFLDSEDVDEYYAFDAFLGTRQSSVALAMIDMDLNYDTAIIFEWDMFTIQGGSEDYIILRNW